MKLPSAARNSVSHPNEYHPTDFQMPEMDGFQVSLSKNDRLAVDLFKTKQFDLILTSDLIKKLDTEFNRLKHFSEDLFSD